MKKLFLAAIVFVILERLFPYTKDQKILREGFFDDFAMYTIAQNYILSILIFGVIITFIDNSTGISRLQLFAKVPIWAQLIFFVVTHDLYIYWMHRWMHKNKWLWRLHEAHHSPKKVDWLSGSRSHPLEIILNQTIEIQQIKKIVKSNSWESAPALSMDRLEIMFNEKPAVRYNFYDNVIISPENNEEFIKNLLEQS